VRAATQHARAGLGHAARVSKSCVSFSIVQGPAMTVTS